MPRWPMPGRSGAGLRRCADVSGSSTPSACSLVRRRCWPTCRAMRIGWPSPTPNHPGQHMTTGEYYGGWTRILKRAGVSHVGTHSIRHRSATDIANSGIPVKVGMALTAHKTVAMFMRYVHTEDKPVREASELVPNRRKTITGVHRIESAMA